MSGGHPLQIPKALTWISYPMAPFCPPCRSVTPITPFWKMGSGQRWLHKPPSREVTWAESTSERISLCGSVTSEVMRSPCFLGWNGQVRGAVGVLFFLSKAPGWEYSPMCHLSIPGQSHSNLSPSASSSPSPIISILIKVTKTLKAKEWHFLRFSSREPHLPVHTEMVGRGEEGQALGRQEQQGTKWRGTLPYPGCMPEASLSSITTYPRLSKEKNHILHSGTDSCMIFDKISLIFLRSVLFN